MTQSTSTIQAPGALTRLVHSSAPAAFEARFTTGKVEVRRANLQADFRSWAGLTACVAAATFLLTGCGEGPRGSATPTAMEQPQGSQSSGREVVTPAAPDSPPGGSSGSRGMSAVPDSSGGPSSGGAGSTSGDASRTTDAAQARGETGGPTVPGSARAAGGNTSNPITYGGTSAREAAGAAGSSGSTNSTPSSSTGNMSR
jgi:hypothetical protein